MAKTVTMTIDGKTEEYIKASEVQSLKTSVNTEGMERCVIRSYASGVFVGYVKEKKAELNGVNCTIINCKRIHYWDGANSLTQFALEGVKKGENCRFTDEVPEQWISDVIEIIPMTESASKNIDEVKVWKK